MQPPVSRRNRSNGRPACCGHARTIPTERLPPRRARSLIVAALLAVALALAGCGGSSSPAVAHLSSGKGTPSASPQSASSAPESVTTHQQKEVDYAKCLRAHGAGEVPEPGPGKSIVNGGDGDGPNPGPPQLHAAQKACSNLLPSGGGPSPQMQKQTQERALKFAQCMRSHGVPSFPDPSGGAGGHTRIGGSGSSVDPNSPQFEAAGKACRKYFGPAGSKGAPAAAPSGGDDGGLATAIYATTKGWAIVVPTAPGPVGSVQPC
jgi:hypothetical protein